MNPFMVLLLKLTWNLYRTTKQTLINLVSVTNQLDNTNEKDQASEAETPKMCQTPKWWKNIDYTRHSDVLQPPQGHSPLLSAALLLGHWLNWFWSLSLEVCLNCIFHQGGETRASVAADSFDLFDFPWHEKMGACFEATQICWARAAGPTGATHRMSGPDGLMGIRGNQ